MADTKISDLTEDASPASGDYLVTVDVSDTTMAASGSTKKVQVANLPAIAQSKVTGLASDLAAKAPLASPSFTGTVTIAALSGLLKAGSGAVSVAVAGTDYLSPTGDGSGLTNLDGGQIATGFIDKARLGTGANTGSVGTIYAQYLRVDGSWNSPAGIPASPGSAIQWRNPSGGNFAGDASFYFTQAGGVVNCNKLVTASQIVANAGSTSTVASIVSAASGQTANLQEWRNSSGTRLKAVGPGGSNYEALSSVTASADVTLDLTGPSFQFINANGANRNVTLPTVTSSEAGLTFKIKNTATSGAFYLVVKNSGGTQIGSNLTFGQILTVMYDGAAWQVI